MKLKIHLLLFLNLTACLTFGQKKSDIPSCNLFQEFLEGMLLMKDGQKKRMYVNYDKATEVLLMASGPIIMGISTTENELLDTAYIENRKFIRLDNKFLELIYHSKSTTLMVQHKCKIIYSSSVRYLPGGFRRESPQMMAYRTKASDQFIVDQYIIYWIERDQVLHEVTSHYDFRKIFTDQKKQLRKYMTKHGVDFNNTEEVEVLIRFLDEN